MKLYCVQQVLITDPLFFWAENEDGATAEWKQYAEKTYPSFSWDEEEEPRIEQVWADNEDKRYRGYVAQEM